MPLRQGRSIDIYRSQIIPKRLCPPFNACVMMGEAGNLQNQIQTDASPLNVLRRQAYSSSDHHSFVCSISHRRLLCTAWRSPSPTSTSAGSCCSRRHKSTTRVRAPQQFIFRLEVKWSAIVFGLFCTILRVNAWTLERRPVHDHAHRCHYTL